MTRNDKAELVAAELNSRAYGARVWEGGENIRVYVTRQLSRGRQDMGYVEITEGGEINPNGLTRAKATIRDIATAATAATSRHRDSRDQLDVITQPKGVRSL